MTLLCPSWIPKRLLPGVGWAEIPCEVPDSPLSVAHPSKKVAPAKANPNRKTCLFMTCFLSQASGQGKPFLTIQWN